MTPFFGIIYKDKRLAQKEAFRGMSTSILDWGYDSANIITNHHVIFGQFASGKAHHTHWDGRPQRTQDLIVVGAGRIDNRAEVCDLLDIKCSEELSNNILVAYAYRRWGQDLCSKLLGDWVFALWDQRKEELFLARDQLGLSQLLYHENDDLLVFSNLIQPILKAPGLVVEHNPMYVRKLLVGVLETGKDTAYNNIFRLLNGCFLVYSDGLAQTHSYWTFEEIKPVRYKSDQEYLQAFLELYRKSVADRSINSNKVGLWLSSGLDSSSVLSLLDEEINEGKIHSFTSVPAYDASEWDSDETYLSNESPLVELLGSQFKKLDCNYCEARDVTPFSVIKMGHNVLGHPLLSTNMYWMWSSLNQAAHMGVDRFYTGEAGNLTISYRGDTFPAKLDLPLLIRLIGKGAVKRENLSKDLKQLVKLIAPPLIPKFLLKTAFGLHGKPRRTDLDQFYLKQEQISDTFLERLRQRPHENTWDNLTLFDDSFDSRAKTLIRQGLTAGTFHHQVGSYLGMQICDPTMDLKLLEFCFGLPDDQFARLSRKRLLIRRAMEARLPNEIVWSKQRGVQGIDLIPRLLADKEEIKAAIEGFKDSNLVNEYVEVERLWDEFEMFARTPSFINYRKVMYWYLTLSICIWLSDLEN